MVNAILPNCTDSFHLYLHLGQQGVMQVQSSMWEAPCRCNRTYADVLLMDYFEQILKVEALFADNDYVDETKIKSLADEPDATHGGISQHEHDAHSTSPWRALLVCVDSVQHAGLSELQNDELLVAGPTDTFRSSDS